MTRQGILVILGHKGSGKTQLSRAFMAEQARSVTIDTLGEYGGVIINDPESLARYLEDNKHQPYFRVSYRDKGMHKYTMDQVFTMLHALRDATLCLEEADKWFGPNRMADAVKWFPKYGRHNRVSLVLVTRRAAEQGPAGTSQADTIVCFKMHEPRDLEWVQGVGGQDAAREVEALGQYEYAYVLDTHDEIRATLDRISGGIDAGPVEPVEPAEPDKPPEPEPVDLEEDPPAEPVRRQRCGRKSFVRCRRRGRKSFAR